MTTAFLDTCVLYPNYLRDTLLRLAERGLFQPCWSADALDELTRNLIEAGLGEEAVMRTAAAMRSAFPEAEISGYQELVPTLTCHPKDRHVLAAAILGQCPLLVTFNLKDFPVFLSA